MSRSYDVACRRAQADGGLVSAEIQPVISIGGRGA
jgi:hypothetical protein